MTITRSIPIAAATLALALATLLPAAGQAREVEGQGPAHVHEAAAPMSEADTTALLNARHATAAYADPAAALAGGYALFTDAAGLACIEQPGAGAMGVHYVNGALVQGGVVDAARPQALVYEVDPAGGLRLVALEYVVIQEGWDAAHDGPPSLFGEPFMLTPAGNRYGLPAFYELHAWVWKANPSGMFSPWNPHVTCGAPLGTAMAATTHGADAHAAYACPLLDDRRQDTAN
jgi:hypothetical protein